MTLDALLSRIGALEQSTPGGRFNINDLEKIWYVKEGAVDLFLMGSFASQNEVTSNLNHFVRINKGQIFVGINLPRECDFFLMGRVCAKTEVISFSKNQCLSLDLNNQEEISDLLDQFIIAITKPNIQLPFPKSYQECTKDVTLYIEKKSIISSRKKIQWCLLDKSESYFIGDEGLYFSPRIDYFPITPISWFEINEDSSIIIKFTIDLLRADLLWKQLNKYCSIIFKLKLIHIENRELFEGIIIYDKVINNRLAIYESVTLLKKCSSFQDVSYLHSNIRQEPLSIACTQISAYQNANAYILDKNYLINTKLNLNEQLNFSKIFYRKVALSPNWHEYNHGPLLAFEKSTNRPLALLPNQKNQYEFQKTLYHGRTIVDHAHEKRFKYTAYYLYERFESSRLKLREIIKSSLKKSPRDLKMIIFCCLMTSLLGLAVPLLSQYIFDNVILNNDKNQLLTIILVLIISVISISTFEITKRVILLNMESRVDAQIQSTFWTRIFMLPISFFKQYTAGELVYKISSLTQIRIDLSGTTFSFIIDSFFVIFSIIIMFYFQPTLAIFTLGGIALFMLMIFALNKKRLVYEEKIILHNGKVFGMIAEFISGITKIRLAGAEHHAILNWSRAFYQRQKIYNKALKLVISIKSISEIMPLVITAIMYIGLNIFDNIKNEFTPGVFIGFNIALTQVIMTGFNLSEVLDKVIRVFPLYKKTKEFTETIPELKIGSIDPGELRGEIELSKVSFSYQDQDLLVLDDINLHIESGEYIAITGKSGAGKSTLIRLLLGFETPQKGSIYFDNNDLGTLDLDLLRRQLGIVLQHDKLLPGTIFENIAGISSLTLEEAWKAAAQAGIADEILNMPMQMDTLINIENFGLSGGQKQRILIARALAKNPKIIIFDEASRSLDNITQKIVLDTLAKLKITRIIITHRLDSLMSVDKIYVVDDNQIKETGTYQELLNKKGLFFEMISR